MSLIQFKRASSARWSQLNPILSAGEPGWEDDTSKWKIGDGVQRWDDLPYQDQTPEAAVTFQDLDDHINSLTPHPVYDDGPSLVLIYENAKV